MNQSELQNLITTGGNLVSLGRSMQVKNPSLFSWVITNTAFLEENVNFNERAYCIINKIENITVCKYSGKKLKFINYFKGYRSSKASDIRKAVVSSDNDSLCLDLSTLKDKFDYKRTLHFPAKYPDLYSSVMSATKSFSDASLNERVYCLLNGIIERPQDKHFKSFATGYTTQLKSSIEDGLLSYAKLVGSSSVKHGRKIKCLITENKITNAKLYRYAEDQEGINFVTCPILNIRKLFLRENYITGVLLLDYNEFIVKYPNKLACSSYSNKMSTSLSVVQDNGKTIYQNAMIKAKITKSKIGHDGLSIDKIKGQKTRATHMRLDSNGLNGYQKIAIVARPKQIKTMAKQGLRSHPEDKQEWLKYRNLCMWLTVPFKQQVLNGKKTGRCGIDGAWQVDHIFSIVKGYHNKVSPFIIASCVNLAAVPWEQNASKNSRSDIDIAGLLQLSGHSLEESIKIFKLFQIAAKDSDSSVDIHRNLDRLLRL